MDTRTITGRKVTIAGKTDKITAEDIVTAIVVAMDMAAEVVEVKVEAEDVAKVAVVVKVAVEVKVVDAVDEDLAVVTIIKYQNSTSSNKQRILYHSLAVFLCFS